MTRLPTPGSVRGKHNPNVARDAYVVVSEMPHGMRISGHLHKKGDLVRLSAEEARHLLLEGIVERAADQAATAEAALAGE